MSIVIQFFSSLFFYALFLSLPVFAAPDGPYTVSRVIDGDTVELLIDGQKEKIRLIGVDTPETVHPSKPVEYFGKEASAFTNRALQGQQVYLEFDQERVDRYNRLLAYVYRTDGYFLNLELIKEGYGHAYTRFPFAKMDEFRAAEKEAREAGRGLWGDAGQHSSDGSKKVEQNGSPVGSGSTQVFVTKSGKKYHTEGCRYLSKSKIPMSLEDADKRFGPCSSCSPPVIEKASGSKANGPETAKEEHKEHPQSAATQCQATTQKGAQCKRVAQSGSNYCWQHQGTTAKDSEEKAKEDKKERPKAVSSQCQATTKKGTQCKRKAKSGSDYCWQHGG